MQRSSGPLDSIIFNRTRATVGSILYTLENSPLEYSFGAKLKHKSNNTCSKTFQILVLPFRLNAFREISWQPVIICFYFYSFLRERKLRWLSLASTVNDNGAFAAE